MLRLRRSIPAPRLRAPPESLRSPHWGERFTAFALSGSIPLQTNSAQGAPDSPAARP